MANMDASDFLDGSDVDEDNVGVVDQDVENVLLGSDDDEVVTPRHHRSSKSPGTSRGNKFSYTDGGGRHSEEEDDVLNLDYEREEEPLDFDADAGQEGGRRVPPVQVRTSVFSAARLEAEHTSHEERLPSGSSYDENIASNEDFTDRRYVEEDEYDDADDEEEERTSRSRFTTERNVESFGGGHTSGSSSSVGIPIQTVGERKVLRPGIPEGRPRHWNNHNNGPRHAGPRHPGRNQRFPHPPRPGSNENMHMRGGMNQPIVQFNEGLFTDFNQPMRHPHPRHRPPQPGRFESPRVPDMGPHHRHPMHPQDMNNMRPGFGPHNNRPFFPPNENRFGPPRGPPPPGNMIHPQHQAPPVQQAPRPEFNRGPRPPRYPPNNFNHRGPGPRPPQPMNSHSNQQHMERPQFPPPRQHHPHYEMPPPQNRPPNPQGFHQPPPNGPPGYNQPPPPRFMGHPRPPGEAPQMPYYGQEQQPSYHSGQEPVPPSFHHETQWSGPSESHHLPNQSPWTQQQPQQPNYGGGPGYAPNMFEQTSRPANTGIIYSTPHVMHQANPSQMSFTLHTSQHQLEIPITKSIYIKPNSEIHEAISKGQLRHHIRDDDRRYHESASSSSSKHYDDHYRDRERDHRDRPSSSSSSSRRESSPSERRRDDDYHDERRSYHQHHEKRPRRRYEDDRRQRSESPERKISRPDRQVDIAERKREREREAEREKEREAEREREREDKREADKLLEEAKKMGLGEDYVKKLEEQRKLRERILKTKEQRRKQVKVPADGEPDANKDSKNVQTKDTGSRLTVGGSKAVASGSSLQKGSMEIEADSTVATAKTGKPKKILRIVKDKSGKIISKKVHVVLVAKPHQDGQQSTSTS